MASVKVIDQHKASGWKIDESWVVHAVTSTSVSGRSSYSRLGAYVECKKIGEGIHMTIDTAQSGSVAFLLSHDKLESEESNQYLRSIHGLDARSTADKIRKAHHTYLKDNAVVDDEDKSASFQVATRSSPGRRSAVGSGSSSASSSGKQERDSDDVTIGSGSSSLEVESSSESDGDGEEENESSEEQQEAEEGKGKEVEQMQPAKKKRKGSSTILFGGERIPLSGVASTDEYSEAEIRELATDWELERPHSPIASRSESNLSTSSVQTVRNSGEKGKKPSVLPHSAAARAVLKSKIQRKQQLERAAHVKRPTTVSSKKSSPPPSASQVRQRKRKQSSMTASSTSSAVFDRDDSASTGSKKRKGVKGKPSDLSDKIYEEQKKQETFLARYCIGTHDVDVDHCKLAHKPLSVRPINETQVATLQKQMKATSVATNFPLSVYVWGIRNEAGELLVRKDGGKWKPNWSLLEKADNVHVFRGNHRLSAIKNLHRIYNRNKEYQKWKDCIWFVVPTDDKELLSRLEEALLVCAGIDNFRASKQLRHNFKDMVITMHEAIVDHYGNDPVVEPGRFKDKYCTAFGFNSYTIDPMFQLATIRGPAWDLILKVLNGQTAHSVDASKRSTFKVPNSMSHFQNMANLLESDRDTLLRLLVAGDIKDMKEFKDRCIDMKALYALRNHVVQELSHRGVKSWADIENDPQYEPLKEPAWIRSWLPEVRRIGFDRKFILKANMHSNFAAEVEDRLGSNISVVPAGTGHVENIKYEVKGKTLRIQIVHCRHDEMAQYVTPRSFDTCVVDPPFGVLKNVEWDVAWKKADFENLFSQLRIVSTNHVMSLFSYCAAEQYHLIYETAKASGWQDVSLGAWYKSDAQNGGGSRLTSSLEFIATAWRSGANKGYWNCSKDSRNRHNCFTHPSVSTFSRDHGHVVNFAEKSVELEKVDMIQRFVKPEGWVLSVCGGTGTTAVAALQAGMNCTIVESDITQFHFIKARLNREVGMINNPKSDDPTDLVLPEAILNAPNKCPVCGEAFKEEEEMMRCQHCNASVHSKCSVEVDVQGKKEKWCTAECEGTEVVAVAESAAK